MISKVTLIVSEGSGGVSHDALYTGVGVTVLCGAAVVVVGQVQHARGLAPSQPRVRALGAPVIALHDAGAVVGSLVLSTLLIVTT